MDKRNKQIVIRTLIASAVIVMLYFVMSAKRLVEVDSGHRIVMGTFARVIAVAKKPATAKRCIRAAFEQIENVDTLMSDYRSDSEISRLNREGFEKAVKVSVPTFEVLRRSIEYSRNTDGAFDITVGPLVQLWRQAAEANQTPSETDLAEARSKVGCEKLLLDPCSLTVQFAVKGMKLDLGGIAKGYAIDKAIEAMKECGAVGGMVDIGGDMRCFGAPTGAKKSWLVGLQDPNVSADPLLSCESKKGVQMARLLLTLALNDAAVATSGDYRRFVLVDGKKHSHIINTRTATGAGQLSSVTIIAPEAIDADALATAVTILGAEKGLALIEKIPETEAILIASEAQSSPLYSSGATKYINNRRKYLPKTQK